MIDFRLVYYRMNKNYTLSYKSLYVCLQVPDLPLPSLISLSLSHNLLATVPPELAVNLNSLQNLDLSHNDLTAVPVAIYSYLKLRRLSLAFNPIIYLSNQSFYGVSDTLLELNLMGLQPHIFEVSV